MKKCILLPLHLYQYDIQGNLHLRDKILMYQYSIRKTLQASKGLDVLVVCHGEKVTLFEEKIDNLYIFWSKYYKKPNKNGLFDNNPAQRSIVYEGLNLAKKRGYQYVIKGRADSAILNIAPILDLAEKDSEKYIFTQITTFIEPWLLGDCFMAGKIEKLLKLWAPSKKYHQDGLKYFAKKLMEIEQDNDLFNIIKRKSFFIDLCKLKIVDFRFTWQDKDKWIKDKTFNEKKLLWGKKNKWLVSHKNNIVKGDRPNIITQKMLKKTKIFKYKLIRNIIVFLRKFYKLLTRNELYNL